MTLRVLVLIFIIIVNVKEKLVLDSIILYFYCTKNVGNKCNYIFIYLNYI